MADNTTILTLLNADDIKKTAVETLLTDQEIVFKRMENVFFMLTDVDDFDTLFDELDALKVDFVFYVIGMTEGSKLGLKVLKKDKAALKKILKEN